MAPTIKARAVEIIAHRGASFDAPENTLSSFKLGYQQNADAAELDIHLTRDGRVVVLHDPDTARAAGVAKRVVERTFDELRHLEVGQWGRWRGKGFSERIPALEEVLALVPDGKRLFIEIKCGPEVLAPLARILETHHKKPGQTVLIGLDFPTMQRAKARFPRHAVCWVVGRNTAGRGYPPVQELITKAKASNFGGLDLDKRFPITPQFVDAVHQAGLKLYTWAVDDLRTARAELAAGVDGITTNRPGWLRERLAL
jgi:glycerophosphoryl diester phosphodiesterase